MRTHLIHNLSGIVILLSEECRSDECEDGHQIVQDEVGHPGGEIGDQ